MKKYNYFYICTLILSFLAVKANSQIITTIAGTGTTGFTGDGGMATMAQLHGPFGLALDTAGNIFFADYYNNRIREINTSGIISTVGWCFRYFLRNKSSF
jgi:hypothetical protein